MTLKEPQKKLAERLNETRKTIQKNIRELAEKVAIGRSIEKQIKNLQANIEKAINLTMLGLNVASRDQIDFLNKRIDLLNEKVDKVAGKPKDKKKKKKGGKKSKGGIK